MGRQYEELHTTTIKVPDGVELKESRFIGWDGTYATSDGGLKDSKGVSRSDSYQGTIPVGVGYTAIIELEEAVAFGDFLKPGTDGKAVKGDATEHCARANSNGAAGGFIEAVVLNHVHA